MSLQPFQFFINNLTDFASSEEEFDAIAGTNDDLTAISKFFYAHYFQVTYGINATVDGHPVSTTGILDANFDPPPQTFGITSSNLPPALRYGSGIYADNFPQTDFAAFFSLSFAQIGYGQYKLLPLCVIINTSEVEYVATREDPNNLNLGDNLNWASVDTTSMLGIDDIPVYRNLNALQPGDGAFFQVNDSFTGIDSNGIPTGSYYLPQNFSDAT